MDEKLATALLIVLAFCLGIIGCAIYNNSQDKHTGFINSHVSYVCNRDYSSCACYVEREKFFKCPITFKQEK